MDKNSNKDIKMGESYFDLLTIIFQLLPIILTCLFIFGPLTLFQYIQLLIPNIGFLLTFVGISKYLSDK